MVHPVSNYSLPYELTFSLKPEMAIRLVQSFSNQFGLTLFVQCFSHQFGLALFEALAF